MHTYMRKGELKTSYIAHLALAGTQQTQIGVVHKLLHHQVPENRPRGIEHLEVWEKHAHVESTRRLQCVQQQRGSFLRENEVVCSDKAIRAAEYYRVMLK